MTTSHTLPAYAVALEQAVRRLHAAKGRYHTQLACCDLYDLLELPNVRPGKDLVVEAQPAMATMLAQAAERDREYQLDPSVRAAAGAAILASLAAPQPAQPLAVAWRERMGPAEAWTPCSQKHHDWVLRAPAEWPGVEVQALSLSLDAPATAVDLVNGLVNALAHARAGLEWYRDMHPEHTDASDDEADEMFDKAVEAASAWLAGEPVPISRQDWRAQAEQIYLAAGDTAEVARECALYLCDQQDWLGQEVEDPRTAAQADLQERPHACRGTLTHAQRLDLATAAFTIAARNDPTCVLKEADAERILGLLSELAGMDLDALEGAPHGQPT